MKMGKPERRIKPLHIVPGARVVITMVHPNDLEYGLTKIGEVGTLLAEDTFTRRDYKTAKIYAVCTIMVEGRSKPVRFTAVRFESKDTPIASMYRKRKQ